MGMNRPLLAWAFAFLAFRLLCLALFADAAFTPEEALRGSMAIELHRFFHGQPHLPLSCLPPDHYLGGSLVTALITSVNYEWLGISLFTLKLTALLFALAALLIAYPWLERRSGRRAAHCFAALYTFAPPTFLFLGALSMGYHTESVAFLAAMIVLADSSAFAALGLVAGLAFWFSNVNAIGLIASLVMAPRALRSGRFYAALALGLTPWILRSGQGLAFFQESIELLPNPGAKFLSLVTHVLPHAPGLSPSLSLLYCALLLVAVASPLRRVLGIYISLFALFYCFTRFSINPLREDPVQYRYMQPLFFLLFLAVATAPRRVPVSAALVALALFGTLGSPRTAPFGRAWRYHGTDAASLSARAMETCFRGPGQLSSLLKWIDSAPTEWERNQRSLPFLRVYDFAALPPDLALPQDRPLFARGFGAAHVNDALENAARVPAIPFWRGVADSGAERLPEGVYERVSPEWLHFSRSMAWHVSACFLHRDLPSEKERWAARGEGAAIADCGVTPEGIRERLEAAAKNGAPKELAWGAGWQLRLRYSPDSLRASDRIALLPEWAREEAARGADAAGEDYGI